MLHTSGQVLPFKRNESQLSSAYLVLDHLEFRMNSWPDIIMNVQYIFQSTWGNHPKIFTLAGLLVKTCRYYNPETRGLDFEACNVKWLGLSKDDLELTPEDSYIPLKPRDLQIANNLISSDILQVGLMKER